MEKVSEEKRKDDAESFSHLTWSRDSRNLYFRGWLNGKQKTTIMKYDFVAGAIQVLYSGPDIAFMTVNDCSEVFASTIDPKGDFCLISTDGNRYYDFEEINKMIFPAWLPGCTEAIFDGCGPHSCAVFLWNEESNALRLFTPFEDSSLNGIRIHYSYDRFAASFIPKRIIFGYHELRVREGEGNSTLNLGAMDLETGKAWKIVELENDWEKFRWFSSETEDAIYFFKSNEKGHLDSLWKVKSDGSGMGKLLDGDIIGEIDSVGTIVSWSRDGERVAIKYRYPGCEKRIALVNILTGQVNILEFDVDIASFALSPDGRKLAYVTRGNELRILTIETGFQTTVSTDKRGK
jgi:hypothetical protein